MIKCSFHLAVCPSTQMAKLTNPPYPSPIPLKPPTPIVLGQSQTSKSRPPKRHCSPSGRVSCPTPRSPCRSTRTSSTSADTQSSPRASFLKSARRSSSMRRSGLCLTSRRWRHRRRRLMFYVTRISDWRRTRMAMALPLRLALHLRVLLSHQQLHLLSITEMTSTHSSPSSPPPILPFPKTSAPRRSPSSSRAPLAS